jgi:uncharacterized membrane protein
MNLSLLLYLLVVLMDFALTRGEFIVLGHSLSFPVPHSITALSLFPSAFLICAHRVQSSVYSHFVAFASVALSTYKELSPDSRKAHPCSNFKFVHQFLSSLGPVLVFLSKIIIHLLPNSQHSLFSFFAILYWMTLFSYFLEALTCLGKWLPLPGLASS